MTELGTETLEERVRVRGPRPFGEVQRLVFGVSRAIGQAHLRKRGHGGITPGAILCVPGEGARALRVELALPRIPFVPSLAWTALEVARGAPPSPASDVVALGLVAFHALAGASLWRSVDRAGRIGDPILLLREMIAPPRASERIAEIAGGRPCAPLPSGFDVWLARCLAPAPSERFGTAPKASLALQGPRARPLARARAAPVVSESLPMPWKTARE